MGENWQIYCFIGGVLILIFTLLRYGQRRRRARARPAVEPVAGTRRERTPGALGGGASATPPASGELHEEAVRVVVQLQEAAREIEGRLDTRVRLARGIIAELEAKEAALRRAADRAEELLAQLPDGSPTGELFLDGPAGSGGSDEPGAASSARAPTPEGQARTGGTVATSFTGPATGDPEEARISELLGRGLDADAISRELGRPLGEVQLVVSLLGAKKPNQA